SKAIATLRTCSIRFPTEPDIYLQIAELQAAQADYIAVRATIREAVDNLTNVDEDWRLSSLLALGETDQPPSAILEATRVDSHLYDGISALLSDYWPPFEELSETAKQEWTKGSYLWCFLPEKNIASKFTLVALLAFIKALDLELARRVFEPAREY